MPPHCIPYRGPSGAATLPHRLPLRFIPPQRFACGSSHSRGHGRPRSVRKSSRLRGKCLFPELLLLRHSKSVGPSAPIAYATYVSPPDEAAAWPWCRYPMGDEAVAWPGAAFLQITARTNPCSRHLWGTLARAVASICAREEPNTGVHTLRTFAADSSCDCFATNR